MIKRNFIFSFFLLIIIGCSTVSATATYTYDGAARQNKYIISVTGPDNTLNSIYSDLNNDSLISKSGGTYTLNYDIVVQHNSSLSINNTYLVFGSPVRIWNKGNLFIDGSHITSAAGDQANWGYIECRNLNLSGTPWQFCLLNSTISKIGPGGKDEWGEQRPGIFGYPTQTDEGIHATGLVNISNNSFTNFAGIAIGNVSTPVVISYNNFTNISYPPCQYLIIAQTADIYHNYFENCNVHKIVFGYGDYNVHENAFINNTLSGGGSIINNKEGIGGGNISNNYISGGSADYILLIGSSHHSKWTQIKNNTITDIAGVGITLQGNGYDAPKDDPDLGIGYDVRGLVKDNIIKNCGCGIELLGVGNFGNPHQGPKHVLTQNNSISGCRYGYVIYDCANVTNVTLVNDSIFSCWGADIYMISLSLPTISYPKIVDLNYSTETTHVCWKDNSYYPYLLEYKSLNWTIKNTYDSLLSANIQVSNNVNSSYPLIYYNDSNASAITNSKLGSAPSDAIMLVRKGISAGAVGDYSTSTTYENMDNYSITVSKSPYTSVSLSGYNPTNGTTTTFTLYPELSTAKKKQ